MFTGKLMPFFFTALALINIISFSLMGIDKGRAKKGKWRIKESTLLVWSFLFGGIGAFAGMHIFHHKTKHIKFKILVPVSIAVNAVCIILLLKL